MSNSNVPCNSRILFSYFMFVIVGLSYETQSFSIKLSNKSIFNSKDENKTKEQRRKPWVSSIQILSLNKLLSMYQKKNKHPLPSVSKIMLLILKKKKKRNFLQDFTQHNLNLKSVKSAICFLLHHALNQASTVLGMIQKSVCGGGVQKKPTTFL